MSKTQDELTEQQVNEVLDRFDQTAPELQRQIIIKFIGDNIRLREGQHVPGAFVCPVCDFTLQKSILCAKTGRIGDDDRPVEEKCPNDGAVMRRQSWKQLTEELAKGFERVIEQRNSANKLLCAARPHVPPELKAQIDQAVGLNGVTQ